MSNFNQITESNVPILIDFHAQWCGPCKTMSPILDELKKQFGEKIRILKIDVDRNQKLAEQLKIRSVPTLMLFKSGVKLWRESGVYSLNQLISIIQPHLK
jgi:thioredoxin 1